MPRNPRAELLRKSVEEGFGIIYGTSGGSFTKMALRAKMI